MLAPHASMASIDLVAFTLYLLVESLPLHYGPINDENWRIKSETTLDRKPQLLNARKIASHADLKSSLQRKTHSLYSEGFSARRQWAAHCSVQRQRAANISMQKNIDRCSNQVNCNFVFHLVDCHFGCRVSCGVGAFGILRIVLAKETQ
jgi:hypothetical protein